MKQLLYAISGFLCLSLLCSGCDSDDESRIEKELIEVPIEFNFTSNGSELETRTSPVNPGYTNEREIYVDQVKVYIYQRSSEQMYETDREGFAKRNELLLPAERTGGPGAEGQPRFTARGKIPLESGYEYRMTAVAYSATKGEDLLFKLNDSFYDYAEIALLDNEEYKTPELFFGNVVYQDTDTVFRYENQQENQKKLTGWLYRGVAGIELNLTNVSANVKQIDLLADSIHTRVKARIYDDFHSAYGIQKDGSFKHFVIGSWHRNADLVGDNKIKIIGPNLLAVCTSLSLRITIAGEEEGKDEQVVCRLQVRKNAENNESKRGEGSQLRSIPGDDGYGTGIIPGGEETPVDPEEPDIENENPYRICFKRNNYYILHGDYAKLTTMMYVLQVTVNPNWDGDVYLPLDKSDNGN